MAVTDTCHLASIDMLVRKFHDQNGAQLSFARQLPSFSLVLNLTAPDGGTSAFSASPDVH